MCDMEELRQLDAQGQLKYILDTTTKQHVYLTLRTNRR